MEVTNASLDWTPEDALNWEKFLHTQTGSRLIPKWVEQNAPPLLEKGDVNEILVRSGKLLGFQAAVKGLLELSVPPQAEEPKKPENYPSLLDDSQWPDTK